MVIFFHADDDCIRNCLGGSKLHCILLSPLYRHEAGISYSIDIDLLDQVLLPGYWQLDGFGIII